MQNISGAFKRALYYDNRAYIERAVITLVDDTVLTLTNENIWQSGFSVEDAVGASEDSFSALGSAIVNQAKIVINNIYGEFSDYNFNGAKMVLYVGLELPDGDSTRQEMIKKGTYIIDEAVYNGSLITITALDYMMLFDKPYSESLLVYPASADTIIRGACTDCGVSLATLNFPFKETEIAERPNEEATTYREVISYVASMCGCFARCNADGRLELKWFDQALLESTMEGGLDGGSFDSSTPYSTGDAADGGTFRPWNTGSAVDGGAFNDTRGLHYISSIYQSNISVDDVVITGIEIEIEIEVDGNKSKDIRKTGTSGYTVQIADNPFITSDNVDTMLSRLGTQLIGLTFRKASLSHSSDPSIEAGDIAIIIDQKNNVYPILITQTVFTAGASQRTVCGASTPARKSAVRFSEQTKSYVELRKEMKEQKSTYEQALEDLAERIDNADGLYETQVPQTGGGVITYMHNKPDLEDSDVQIMISNVGVTVTANGTAQQPTWYGLTVDGQLIASILNTVGVNADWINTGQFTVYKNGSEVFFADVDTGTVRIASNVISDTVDSLLTQQSVFNKLTNNGTAQGIFLQNGQLYINMTYLQTGTLKIGGANNGNGTLEVYNASGVKIGKWDKDGIDVTSGTISGNLIKAGKIMGNSGTAYFDLDNDEISASMLHTSLTTTIPDGEDAGNLFVEIKGREPIRYREVYLKIYNNKVSSKYIALIPANKKDGNRIVGYDDLSIESNVSGNLGGVLELDSGAMLGCGTNYSNIYVYPDYVDLTGAVSSQGNGINFNVGPFTFNGNTNINGGLTIYGNSYKSRAFPTKSYGDRRLYCYETQSPLFGDVGEGVIAEDGKCYIQIDGIFAETISLSQYQVFLQKYGAGDCWVSDRNGAFFVVEGTPGLSFGWELKAKQADLTQFRLDRDMEEINTVNDNDYAKMLEDHIEEIRKEREVE